MEQVHLPYDSLVKVNNLMWLVIKQLTKNKKLILDQFGLTCSQFEILSALYYVSKTKEEIIQIDLAEKTQIDPMTTSTILRNLQKKELITRARSLINTRTVIVQLTDKGEDLYLKTMHVVNLKTELIYQNVNEKLLMSQLLILSDKLNKLNS